MTELNTFSAAVDDVVVRSGRVDRKADIIAFVRETIRELHALRVCKNDLTEDTLTADADNYTIAIYNGSAARFEVIQYSSTLNISDQDLRVFWF